MSRRVRLAGTIAVLAALATAPAAFGGATLDFNAKIRIKSHGTKMDYRGSVRSDVEACQVGRTVRISSSGRLIGVATTGDDGKYSVVAKAVKDGSSVKFKLKPNGPDCDAATLFVQV